MTPGCEGCTFGTIRKRDRDGARVAFCGVDGQPEREQPRYALPHGCDRHRPRHAVYSPRPPGEPTDRSTNR